MSQQTLEAIFHYSYTTAFWGLPISIVIANILAWRMDISVGRFLISIFGLSLVLSAIFSAAGVFIGCVILSPGSNLCGVFLIYLLPFGLILGEIGGLVLPVVSRHKPGKKD